MSRSNTDEFAARTDGKIRPYRSQAEKTAVTQRNVQIGLSVLILCISAASLLVQVF